jgi:hypothetical protein
MKDARLGLADVGTVEDFCTQADEIIDKISQDV